MLQAARQEQVRLAERRAREREAVARANEAALVEKRRQKEREIEEDRKIEAYIREVEEKKRCVSTRSFSGHVTFEM